MSVRMTPTSKLILLVVLLAVFGFLGSRRLRKRDKTTSCVCEKHVRHKYFHDFCKSVRHNCICPQTSRRRPGVNCRADGVNALCRRHVPRKRDFGFLKNVNKEVPKTWTAKATAYAVQMYMQEEPNA